MKIGTLFSGIGAPEFALKAAGIAYTIEFACDNDPYVQETYEANHQAMKFYPDVTMIEILPYVDLLIMGFPCQPFSFAGKGKGLEDERGKIVLKAFDLIRLYEYLFEIRKV